jgi:predicted unusual protein kinase regulating ubiquinone biosynthesis (AarF/ABC1/UbiB family)
MSTIGQGLLPQQYLDALRPLQDGVPPRSYAEVSEIIQRSTGKSMDELFVHFEEEPIGSASIAQVHRATLRPRNEGEEPLRVVIKVQYPEGQFNDVYCFKTIVRFSGNSLTCLVVPPLLCVRLKSEIKNKVADLFEADLSNLEIATKLFSPENVEVARALRRRHENELDFTKEAENLRECTRDMQKHGVEPSLVRIPRVVDEICTPNVLAMEYLEGISLSNAIAMEQRRVAKALGMRDGDELKSVMAGKMRKHFENGGGAAGEGGGMEGMLGGNKMKFVDVFGPSAAALLRMYASVKDDIENAALSVGKFGSQIRRGWTRGWNIDNPDDLIHDAMGSNNGKKTKVNLGRALKTLVHVHGIQMLLSGTYNADPHPGNVLILPDGRLGLLDYGMVGRLSSRDRETVAETIMALSDNDKTATAKIYRENGYKASFRDDGHVDDATLHRFATFHLDRIDLSPLTLDNGEVIDTLELFRNTREKVVPGFIEEGRRLGGLLMGVNAQAARPISLAKEWRPIAQQALKK